MSGASAELLICGLCRQGEPRYSEWRGWWEKSAPVNWHHFVDSQRVTCAGYVPYSETPAWRKERVRDLVERLTPKLSEMGGKEQGFVSQMKSIVGQFDPTEKQMKWLEGLRLKYSEHKDARMDGRFDHDEVEDVVPSEEDLGLGMYK
jgi:hypothetical protein